MDCLELNCYCQVKSLFQKINSDHYSWDIDKMLDKVNIDIDDIYWCCLNIKYVLGLCDMKDKLVVFYWKGPLLVKEFWSPSVVIKGLEPISQKFCLEYIYFQLSCKDDKKYSADKFESCLSKIKNLICLKKQYMIIKIRDKF